MLFRSKDDRHLYQREATLTQLHEEENGTAAEGNRRGKRTETMTTIIDMFKAHEQKNREIDRVVISNCRMLLQAGFCYH